MQNQSAGAVIPPFALMKKAEIIRIRSIMAQLAALVVLSLAGPAIAQSGDDADTLQPSENAILVESRPGHLVLEGDFTIEVVIRGRAVRLEVDAAHFGPPSLNLDLARELRLRGDMRYTANFGGVEVAMLAAEERVAFGHATPRMRVGWSPLTYSRIADGVIGVHNLPYNVVTFVYGEFDAAHRTQSFPLERRTQRLFERVGVELEVDDDQLFVMFANSFGPNLVTAGTANFIATRQDGAFVPDSNAIFEMYPDFWRPTRDMRLANPILLGDLEIDTFAVRVADHGNARSVGEAEEDDPRFDENTIFVSDRRRRGRDDQITRIGRYQLAHCSELTYDLEEREVRLTCAAQ